jgi:hypothetical protein
MKADLFTHPEDAREIRQLRAQIENYRDFISWIFGTDMKGGINSEGIDWMSEDEAWELFEKWQDENYKTEQP